MSDNQTYLEISYMPARFQTGPHPQPPRTEIACRFHGHGWGHSALTGYTARNPTAARLQEIFSMMLAKDLPAVEPESLALETRLLAAGVRIIQRHEVEP
jgi:hypothetical protein